MRWPRTGRKIPGHLPRSAFQRLSARHQLLQNRNPGCIRRLFAEVGVLSGRAFAPAREPVGANFHQQHAPLPGFTEAGGEGWIKDMLSSRRTIDSIFMKTCLDIGCGECEGPLAAPEVVVEGPPALSNCTRLSKAALLVLSSAAQQRIRAPAIARAERSHSPLYRS